MVDAAGIAVDRVDVVFELDMHYLGQTHTVAVPLPVTIGASGTGITEAGDPRCLRQGLRGRRSAGCCRAFRRASSRCARPRSAAARPSTFRPSRRTPTRRSTRRRRARARSGSRRCLARHQIWSRLDLPYRRGDRGAGRARAARRHDLHRSRPQGHASTISATSSWSAHEPRIDRAAAAAICRTTSSIRTAPMRAAAPRAPTSPHCRRG